MLEGLTNTTFIASAGGGSIIHHITSYGGDQPLPFQKAIPLSAGWVPVTTDKQQEDATNIFLSNLNATTVGEAQNASSSEVILANARAIGAAPWSFFGYGPVVDGSLVPSHPQVSLLKGHFNRDVSVMTGHVSHESPSFSPPFVKTNIELEEFIGGLFPTVKPGVVEYILDTLYPEPGLNRTLKFLAELGFTCNVNYLRQAFEGKTYNYEFKVPPSLHGSDFPYVFYGGPDSKDVKGGVYHGPLGAVRVDLAVMLQRYITNFVKGGDPNGEGLPEFPSSGVGARMLALDTEGVAVERDTTDNERCSWLQSVPYG